VTGVLLAGVAAVAVLVALSGRVPSAVSLVVEGDRLVVTMTGAAAALSLRRRIDLPVAAIQGIAVAPRRMVPQTGLRLPGTGIPGALRAGSYGTGSTRDFWLVRRADFVLVVELEPGAEYRRLVLELPDPHAEALRLRPVLGSYTGSFAPV
jgi:hypothetical protein